MAAPATTESDPPQPPTAPPAASSAKKIKPAKSNKTDTPAMRQFKQFKADHPGCVLFFRMGDFYEMFFDDAELAHRVLGVTLTQRTAGVPMAGVPYHSVEGYLRRMVQAGHRVAICDQVEEASQAKGVVKRDVTRVVTPGTLTDESLLSDEQVNPCAAVVFHAPGNSPGSSEQATASIAWAELSTGAFQLATVDQSEVGDELARINPSELLYCETADGTAPPRIAELPIDCPRTGRPGWQFRMAEATEALRKQYRVATLGGFGLHDEDPALAAAGGLLAYLLETQRNDDGVLAHLRPPQTFTRTKHLIVDQASLASLEVEQTLRAGDSEGSLLAVLRRGGCVTAMGKRRLRDWLCYPLADRAAIEDRQRVVQALVDDSRFAQELADALDGVHDVPRIIARLAVGRALPRDLVALGRSASRAEVLENVLAERPSVAPFHERLTAVLPTLVDLADRIQSACKDEGVPAHLREGGLFRDGHDAQLDEYRGLQRDSNVWLANYQKQLIDETGVSTLKVGYNKVFGYYIELSAVNSQKIKDDDPAFAAWTRKQTLKNAERFITPALKEFEGKVLSAEGRAIAREQHLFAELCGACEKEIDTLHGFADVAADLDVLLCFGRRAARHRYVKPTLTDEPGLHVVGGRHPVLDELLGDRYVPNDVSLGVMSDEFKVMNGEPQDSSLVTRDSSLALITGPNMAGKSTYIRMTALIALLAHTGSFVPAESATVGLCDRIFTRVGAHDELHAGRSTFMVEMTETANICHHATPRSLVILDEIGRGTSTLDGLSLAWAIAEHLADVGCRCLFATHYHELTTLADPAVGGERAARIANLNVSVREWNDEIVFLHRIIPGATDRSYGIHVAKIAGLPGPVVDRAHQLLGELAVNHQGMTPTPPDQNKAASNQATKPAPVTDLPLFAQPREHPAVDELRKLDLNQMTPMQAFDVLRQLHDQAKDDSA
ncbi:MAG: DNA mismatch repair protein MutS [Planctomycetota bacterium]